MATATCCESREPGEVGGSQQKKVERFGDKLSDARLECLDMCRGGKADILD